MNREDLQKYIGITGYSLGQVEKDYFQHIVLSALSRKIAGQLVFKGGTALQKIGIIDRFSEDLDFTAKKDISIEHIRDICSNAINTYNFVVESDKVVQDIRTTSFRLKIQGPLFKNQRGICTIRVEISKREPVILKPQRNEFTPAYNDILPYFIENMDLEEILAEKIRTIYTRNKARDLYDIYKINKKQVPLKIELVNKKLAFYNLSFDKEVFLKKCNEIQPYWNSELQSLIENVVTFIEAFESVKMKVRDTQ